MNTILTHLEKVGANVFTSFRSFSFCDTKEKVQRSQMKISIES